MGVFVDYCNNERYHESLNNVTPADVYYGRDKAIIRERVKIKKLTIQNRRLKHQKQAA
ncbi:transposase [Parasedimentitalea marina]|uniref:Transposase n=1 Tax=Parasedimentitalea marina TaxID=2483033 RepID=A0A3T0N906_9RHOB|nr:transposase [Parasedimentitalea marina]